MEENIIGEKNNNVEILLNRNGSSSKKKIKNLIALSILLGGLFGGSIFVDVIQMINGGGVTPEKLSKSDVFRSAGKTWVGYSESIIKADVLTDDTCEECKPDEVLLWLRRIVPTILTRKIDQNSEEGKKIVSDFNIKTIPAFVFSKEIKETEFYQQASVLFEEKDGRLFLKAAEVGIPIGKYIQAPNIFDYDIRIGSDDAKVKIVEFSDFLSVSSQTFHLAVKKILAEYGNRIQYVFKQFPFELSLQSGNAALASECANDQKKFMEYADKLFESQSDWGMSEGLQKFKNYARQKGLNAIEFDQCLDEQKFQDKIGKNIEDGKGFGVSETPVLFINQQFKNGIISYDDLKNAIESELAK